MVRLIGAAHVDTGRFERPTAAGLQFVTESIESPLVEQERQPRTGACFAGAKVTEQEDDLRADFLRLIGPNEDVERPSGSKSTGAHFAADEDVEAQGALVRGVANGRYQGDVLRRS